MCVRFSYLLCLLALVYTSFSTVHAQSRPVDSVIVKVGSKSRIIISIGDPSDISVLRHYDVEGLIEDMIRRVEDRQTFLPPPSRYSVDSVVSAARSEAERTMRELEKEIEALEREMPGDGKNAVHLEKMRELTASVERLARMQARMAREQAERYRTRQYPSYKWPNDSHDDDENDDGDDEESEHLSPLNRERKRTINSFHMDFGINNYLSAGKFVDSDNLPYTVRSLGSWYVGTNSVNRTRLANKFFLEWGGGIGFYNFKFLNDSIRVTKDNASVSFNSDQRDFSYRKSKLTAYYAQVFLVPVIDFGGNRQKPGLLFDERSSSSFRIGLGPYAGYRIDSYVKQSYKVEGDRQIDRRHDNFYLNNLRYGLRLQMGFRDTELFFNYDLNELFTSGKGPALQAFSFGVSF